MGVTVISGQIYNVSSGLTDNNDIINFGGVLNVLSGGTISSTQDSGVVTISSGGTASGTIVSAGGMEIVSACGIANNTVVSSACVENVLVSGAVNSAVVDGVPSTFTERIPHRRVERRHRDH